MAKETSAATHKTPLEKQEVAMVWAGVPKKQLTSRKRKGCYYKKKKGRKMESRGM